MRRARLITVLAAALTMAAGTAGAQSNLPKPFTGKYGYLAKYLGSYDSVKLLNEPAVKAALIASMGSDYPLLAANLATRGAIGLDENCLTLSGNMEHNGIEENASVYFDMDSGRANVRLHHDERTRVYSLYEKYEYLPRHLRYEAYFDRLGYGGYRVNLNPPPGIKFGVGP